MYHGTLGGRGDLLAYPTLCLWAEPQWVWERNVRLRQDPRSLEKFTQIEYGPARNALYQQADLQIDLPTLEASLDAADERATRAVNGSMRQIARATTLSALHSAPPISRCLAQAYTPLVVRHLPSSATAWPFPAISIRSQVCQ